MKPALWGPVGLLSVLAAVSFTAAGSPLEAKLCDRVDLISGDCRAAEKLIAGQPGFAVALTSTFSDSVLVGVAWERSGATPGSRSERLAEDMVVLGAGQTKLVPLRATAGALAAGSYRLVFSVAGRPAQRLDFEVVGEEAPGRPEASAAETVTEALERVFSTKEGPEAALEGIAVVGEFFDRALAPAEQGATTQDTVAVTPSEEPERDGAPDGAPSAQPTRPRAAPTPAPAKTPAQAPPPAPPPAPATSRTGAAESGTPIAPVDQSDGDAGMPLDIGGLELVLAREAERDQPPRGTGRHFDAETPVIHLAMRATIDGLPNLALVEWVALEVEGLPSGEELGSSRTVLRQGSWRSASFRPPEGGFWPGRYQARVRLEDGQPLAELDFEVASGLETALLAEERPPVTGINIALAALGGSVIAATSQAGGRSWSKEALIDGFGYGGEDCKPSCGWASAGRGVPQTLTFSFRDGRKARLAGIVLDAESCAGDRRCLESLPREVEVWTSTASPDGGFELVAERRLRPLATRHYIPLPEVDARYLRLTIRSHYGSSRRVQLAEVEVLESPDAASILAGMPIDLALPALGGCVLRFTSEHYRGKAARLLTPGDGNGWRSADDRLPQEITFCLRGGGEALIERLELRLDSGHDPASRPRELAVALSSSGPVQGFAEAARVRLAGGSDQVVIPVQRRGRFVKLRLLDNHGAPYTSLGKVAIIEAQEPGYTSLLARSEKGVSANSKATASAEADPAVPRVQPGDSPDLATPLALGQRISAGFASERQHHFFRLSLPGDEAGALNLELEGFPILRTQLRLLDESGTEMAVFSPSGEAGPDRGLSWHVPPGEYLLDATLTPADIVLAWDISRSLAAHTELLKEAVTGFIEHVDSDEALALLAFNNELHVLVDDFTSDKRVLREAIAGQFQAEMATRLYDAVERAIELLQPRDGAGVIVVMTDGVDMGSRLSTPDFWRLLDTASVRIFTLGLGGELKAFDPEAGISGGQLLRYLAQAQGGRFIFIPTADELVEAYARIAEELMSGAVYTLKPSWDTGTGTLLVETAGEGVDALAAPAQIELVLDASGSMRKSAGGATRMGVAKEVLADLIQGLPAEAEVALRVYGHRVREGQPGDCQDTELAYPFGKLDKARLVERIQGIKALGTTPIAYSLAQTVEDFGESPGEKTVVLVTDGEEECGGDLAATVADLKAQGLDVRLHIVGFALDEAEVIAQMREAARVGDGRFLNADDQDELREAMAATLAVPYQVRDSAGRIVARGTAGQPLALSAGWYQIALGVPGEEVVQDGVRVERALTTRLQVTEDGPRVGMQVLPPGRDE